MGAIEFRVYDGEYDNIREEYPAITVTDELAAATLRTVLDVTDGVAGGRAAQDVLGRVLWALGLMPEEPASPGGPATASALSNLADMATDAYLADLVVAWA